MPPIMPQIMPHTIQFNQVEPGHWRSAVGDATDLYNFVDLIEKATLLDGKFHTSYVLLHKERMLIEAKSFDDPKLLQVAEKCLQVPRRRRPNEGLRHGFESFLALYGCPICYRKNRTTIGRIVKPGNGIAPFCSFECECGHSGKLVFQPTGNVLFLIDVKTERMMKAVAMLRVLIHDKPCPKCGEKVLQMGYVRPDIIVFKHVTARWLCRCGAHGRARFNKVSHEIDFD